MSDFNVYVMAATLTGLLVFLRLSVTWKILAAFVVMSQCFDLVPQIVYGYFVWDAGAIMLLIATAQLMLTRPQAPKIRDFSLRVLWVFFIWLVFCLIYSLLVYGYPVLNTLKVSRQMIIGYLSIFVFLRLFRVDENALPIFIKWLYVATYILLFVAIVQYAIGTPIMPGLAETLAATLYRGALRYIPVFLPVSLFYLWTILSKYFQGVRVKSHEWIYAVMVLVIVALTYTRGIYIAVLLSFFAMIFLLWLRGRLKATSVVIFLLFVTLGLTVLIAGGWAGRVIDRATSGLEVVLSKSSASSKKDEDTFTGRLLLVQERFLLVAEHNPIVGFGFMHENDMPATMQRKLKYGSVATTPEMMEKYSEGYPYVLSLYSVDIGWGDLALNSGFVGFFLFLLFVTAFLLSYKKLKNDHPPLSHYRLAFFIQTNTLLLLMFNGDTFTHNVQIPALMIAGYWYCSAKLRLEARQPAGSNLPKGR